MVKNLATAMNWIGNVAVNSPASKSKTQNVNPGRLLSPTTETREETTMPLKNRMMPDHLHPTTSFCFSLLLVGSGDRYLHPHGVLSKEDMIFIPLSIWPTNNNNANPPASCTQVVEAPTKTRRLIDNTKKMFACRL